MKESIIEKHLKKRVEQAGGLCYKWVSPGNTGVPDDLVFFKSMIFLIEMKADNGRLSASQKLQHKKLAKQGFDVVVLNSKEAVDDWMDLQIDAIYPTRNLDIVFV